MIIRCDSAAMVSKTSELLPEPETPVNTVSRRFGISMLTSLRLFSRAPCTRIRSWLSATACAVDRVLVLLAALSSLPSLQVMRSSSHRRLVSLDNPHEVGHMLPSSRLASSLKPKVAYLVLNFAAGVKKQMTLPSLA